MSRDISCRPYFYYWSVTVFNEFNFILPGTRIESGTSYLTYLLMTTDSCHVWINSLCYSCCSWWLFFRSFFSFFISKSHMIFISMLSLLNCSSQPNIELAKLTVFKCRIQMILIFESWKTWTKFTYNLLFCNTHMWSLSFHPRRTQVFNPLPYDLSLLTFPCKPYWPENFFNPLPSVITSLSTEEKVLLKDYNQYTDLALYLEHRSSIINRI